MRAREFAGTPTNDAEGGAREPSSIEGSSRQLMTHELGIRQGCWRNMPGTLPDQALQGLPRQFRRPSAELARPANCALRRARHKAAGSALRDPCGTDSACTRLRRGGRAAPVSNRGAQLDQLPCAGSAGRTGATLGGSEGGIMSALVGACAASLGCYMTI